MLHLLLQLLLVAPQFLLAVYLFLLLQLLLVQLHLLVLLMDQLLLMVAMVTSMSLFQPRTWNETVRLISPTRMERYI